MLFAVPAMAAFSCACNAAICALSAVRWLQSRLAEPPRPWQNSAMSTLSTLSALPLDPKELRPLLHAEVDKLRDENLLVLHRVALELELDEVTERQTAGFDADRAAGTLARLPELLREARAALAARRAP